MNRGMPEPNIRMPPANRPPPGRWNEGGNDPNAPVGWGMPPASPPNVGGQNPAWGSKPKPNLGWGDSSDMIDSPGGWGGVNKPVSRIYSYQF
jgi:hypothetical protein